MWILLAEALTVALLPLISDHTVTTENPSSRTSASTRGGVQSVGVQSRLQQFFEDYYPTTTESIPTMWTPDEETTVEPEIIAEPVIRSPALASMSFAAPRISTEPAPRLNMVSMMRSVIGSTKPRPGNDPIIFENPMNPIRNMFGNTGTTMIFSGNTIPPPFEKSETCEDYQGKYKGKCYTLLTQGPCAPDEWLVEKNGVVQCSKGQCRYPRLPYQGQCIDITPLGGPGFLNCSEGMRATPSKDGSVECDCIPGFIYDSTRDQCFRPYQQGPCRRGQYFAPVEERGMRLAPGRRSPAAACVTNPCRQDQMVCYGPTCPTLSRESSCVKLNSLCNNGEYFIMVSVKTLKVGCFDPNGDHAIKNIGSVPAFACGKGMKRDVQGRCRPVSNPNFS